MSDFKELLGFVDALRSKGVRVFRGAFEGSPVEIELGPALEPTASTGPTLPDPDLCRCGHAGYEHGPFCLRGCEPEKCVDPSKEVLNG